MTSSTFKNAQMEQYIINTNLMLNSPAKEFKYFTILLNEDITNLCKKDSTSTNNNKVSAKCTPDMLFNLGKLLRAKIMAHSERDTQLFTAVDIMKNTNSSLVSVMYHLAAEDFVRNSSSVIFKIIECRNATKLVTDWKPSLVDVLISLGHQVIVVEIKEFPHYTDFAYSILRQINYCWKNRLPRSFFYPEDVCSVESSLDKQLIIVSPLLPDGDIDLSSQMQDNMIYEILLMLKESCAIGYKNYLLKRDLRVGKFSDTEIGVNSIRHIYRTLQRQLNSQGENIQMGNHPVGGHTWDSGSGDDGSENFHQFLLSLAGDSLLAAESYIDYCKNPTYHNQDEQAQPGVLDINETVIKNSRISDGGGAGDGDDDDDARQHQGLVHHQLLQVDAAGDEKDQGEVKDDESLDEEAQEDDIDKIIYSLKNLRLKKPNADAVYMETFIN